MKKSTSSRLRELYEERSPAAESIFSRGTVHHHGMAPRSRRVRRHRAISFQKTRQRQRQRQRQRTCCHCRVGNCCFEYRPSRNGVIKWKNQLVVITDHVLPLPPLLLLPPFSRCLGDFTSNMFSNMSSKC